jgi:hypothetical protein
LTPVPIHPLPHFLFTIRILRRSYFSILIHISALSTHFLLTAAAVQCTCSGEPSGEGLAFDNYFYKKMPFISR